MQRKLKICSECGKPSILWRSNPKLCKNCAQKPKFQKKNEAKEAVKADLNVFFASQALVFPLNCENCGRPLNAHDAWARRKSTCHILPKTPHGGFPTVATHPQNKIFMCADGGCYGHDRWDNGDASDRIVMNVYNVAVQRYEAFKSLLNGREQNKAEKYLHL